MKELRLFSGYNILYGKVKEFVKYQLFGKEVDIENINTLKNLTNVEAIRTVFITFRKTINSLTVIDTGVSYVASKTRISKTPLHA